MKSRKYKVDSKINILIVGKYRDYKNLSLIIHSLLLIDNIDIFKIRIIGQCFNELELKHYNQLQTEIIDNSLQEIIELIVNVPYNKMIDYYSISDSLILTSKKELASISIIEAMSYGLIPISTHKNGTATYINRNFGYVFESNNNQDLARILNELTKIDINKYGQLNLEYFINNYTYREYKNKMNLVLKKEFNENI